jgi:hypothetical protein
MAWPALAIITLQLAGHSAVAIAQDIAPDTPPELRDFKLEPDKPKPAPGPLPELSPVIDLPAINPPPAIRRTEAPLAEPKSGAAAKPVAATKREQAAAVVAKPANVAGNETAKAAGTASGAGGIIGSPLLDAAQVSPVIADPLPSAPPIVEGEGAVTPAPANISLPWIWILAALAGLIVLAAAAVLYRRRKRQSLLLADAGFAAVTDAAAHELVIEPEPAPMPVTTTAPRPITPSASLKRPLLEISFVPAKASISLANLTIKGQLRVVNSGDGDADNLRLNAAIITASDRQNEMISAYFSGAAEPGNELGAVKIGERIALDLDLVIPISELQTFGLGEQKLLVPIILSRISYHWGQADRAITGSDEAHFSCIIGRESRPPKPKMGALRLDLGPRSFAPLGQRPVFG